MESAHGRHPEPLAGSPYFFLGRRPFREARLRSYLLAQHRRGRPLSAILGDSYVLRCGPPSLRASVVNSPETIAGLERNIEEAIRGLHPGSRHSF